MFLLHDIYFTVHIISLLYVYFSLVLKLLADFCKLKVVLICVSHVTFFLRFFTYFVLVKNTCFRAVYGGLIWHFYFVLKCFCHMLSWCSASLIVRYLSAHHVCLQKFYNGHFLYYFAIEDIMAWCFCLWLLLYATCIWLCCWSRLYGGHLTEVAAVLWICWMVLECNSLAMMKAKNIIL